MTPDYGVNRAEESKRPEHMGLVDPFGFEAVAQKTVGTYDKGRSERLLQIGLLI